MFCIMVQQSANASKMLKLLFCIMWFVQQSMQTHFETHHLDCLMHIELGLPQTSMALSQSYHQQGLMLMT